MMDYIIAQNEKNSYEKAIDVKCPLLAGVNRVLVIQIRPEYNEEIVEENQVPVIQHGQLWLPKHAVAATEKSGGIDGKNEVVKAIIKSVGPIIGNDGILNEGPTKDIGSLVYVFPSVFETMITLDGFDYMSYSNRDIVAAVRKDCIIFETEL